MSLGTQRLRPADLWRMPFVIRKKFLQKTRTLEGMRTQEKNE